MSKKRPSTPTKLSQREWTALTLEAVPYVNQTMELTRRRDGSALASVPLRRPRFLVPPLSWILPFSSERRVQLDKMGMALLSLCDGRRTVEAVIEKFAEDHRLTFRESQLSVMQFLRQLTDRGIVAIVGLNKDADDS
jgi:hypothetical protein